MPLLRRSAVRRAVRGTSMQTALAARAHGRTGATRPNASPCVRAELTTPLTLIPPG